MTFGLDQVCVRFGRKTALNAVSLPARPSEITVVVGGDGAGKTTCLRTLVGLVDPEDGEVHRPAKERIGYVPATSGLYEDLTVEENLRAVLERMIAGKLEQMRKVKSLLEEFGLWDLRRQKAWTLSGGEKRRLEVARAMIQNPKLIMLDEPTGTQAETFRMLRSADHRPQRARDPAHHRPRLPDLRRPHPLRRLGRRAAQGPQGPRALSRQGLHDLTAAAGAAPGAA